MRILLVEDSKRLQTTISAALRRSGYAVDVSGDGPEGLWLAETNHYDAIVLDIMLPGMDGISILKRLRQKARPHHVLLLTAKDAISDRVHGLESGADDYLVKPFALEELLARVQVLCRRSYDIKQAQIKIDDLEIDITAKKVLRGGQIIKLKPREYLLLQYLAVRANQVVSRSEIEAHIYDGEIDLMSNAVESAISSLRKKIGAFNPKPLIHTRHGLGYMLGTKSE
jgi:DNA-binding response OmpR family regulator